MQRDSALRAIRALAQAGAVRLSLHAVEDSMPDDDVFAPDVLNALVNATGAVEQDDVGVKWKIYGPIIDGSEYAVVVEIRGDPLFVVTCHLPP